jgi:hypothetical protein
LRGGNAQQDALARSRGAAKRAWRLSSSAMMRRMEARISSIDGSCAFAGWLIADSLKAHSLQAHARRLVESMRPRRITRTLDIDSDRSKYGRAMRERNRSPVDTHISRAVSARKM